MFFSILKTRKILKLVAQDKDLWQWKILYFLMIFFLGGYSLAVALVGFKRYEFIPFLMGIVFFFGALFVLFSINLYYHTLFFRQERYRLAKENAEASLRKLKQMQMQLIQNEKMLSLGKLVAGIAHEINNPINFIHGNLYHIENYSQNLLDLVSLYTENYPNPQAKVVQLTEDIDLDFLKADLPRLFESMKVGTNRIRHIVTSLRHFSRLDESQYKRVSLQEGLDSTITIFQSYLKAKKNSCIIEIIKNYHPLPWVDCNPREINQVFINLLSNAVDAIEEKNQQFACQNLSPEPGQIKVTTEVINHNWVRIKISDNGIGIDEDTCDRIFDPFFTTKTVGEGTGLGLSISYQIIVDKHQGNLHCHSIPNQGTEFMIELPT
ncbi:MAG: HAMP domain-containing histidine kinase [Kamptonema sp. SIO4C4]|nr:HAMP domain-containing histidine kinase [Kamptonema sp. SIO4C4]